VSVASRHVCGKQPDVAIELCLPDFVFFMESLEEFIPALKALCDKNQWLQAWLEGVLATFVLKAFMALLPSLLMIIINNFLMLKAGSWAQLKLQNRYFWFQVVFVVLVTAIGRSVLTSLKHMIKEPMSIMTTLADSLPNASHIYLMYMVAGCFTMCMNLLRIGPLMGYWTFKTMKMEPEEARRKAEPEDQDSDGMGARMAKATLMVTIALVFSTCCPIITILGWLYFGIGERVYKYLMVYAETKKPDLGGSFWVAALNHLIIVLGIYVFLMTSILSSIGATKQACVAFLALLWVFHCYNKLQQLVWESLPFEAIAEIDHATKRKTGGFGVEKTTEEYVQPEIGADAQDAGIGPDYDSSAAKQGPALAGAYVERSSRSRSSTYEGQVDEEQAGSKREDGGGRYTKRDTLAAFAAGPEAVGL